MKGGRNFCSFSRNQFLRCSTISKKEVIPTKIKSMTLGKMCWNTEAKYNLIIKNDIVPRSPIRYEHFYT